MAHSSPPRSPLQRDNLARLRGRLLELRAAALALERLAEDEIALVHPDRRVGARNLVDYLALRQQDLRDLQHDLYEVGLSTLGVVHRHVIASLDASIRLLDRLCGGDTTLGESTAHPRLSPARGELAAFADDMLGTAAPPQGIRIMVTMPSEAGEDPTVVESLLAAGMTIMRVNCAHDGPDTWKRMIDHLRAAEVRLGRPCKIAFDLAGPKLRTGPVAAGPEVVRCRPIRDNVGRPISPAAVRFGPDGVFDETGPVLPIDRHLCGEARIGDELHVRDTRGRNRVFRVVATADLTLLCTTDRTAYLTSNTPIELRRGGTSLGRGTVGRLPATEGTIPLTAGDVLVITRDLVPGRAAIRDGDGSPAHPATIGCSLPEVFDRAEVGHRVLLDDGKFEGVVTAVSADRMQVKMRRAGRGRAVLRAEKGLNFPDTPLDLPALTAKDIDDLAFLVRHADMVSLSFVHRAADIDDLYHHLSRLGAPKLGVVLKIENRAAFERLPELIMTAAQRRRIAVMVARGDLGVEIGFERLAEVQEEMLWLCEAAQVPVIWATQVLESLAKNGLPSRGEVTDAAMSTRAECVMLNKGPYIGEAMRFLRDVSRRMSEHTEKTFATHRALNVAASGWLEIDRSRPVPDR